MIKFLAVTDLHYCTKNEPIERRHCLSAKKLKKIIDERSNGCDFIIDLGDTADGLPGYGDQKELMGEIADILKSSNLPYRCVIGNHDTSLPKEQIADILNMPGRYYSFDTRDYTCLVLDANMNDPSAPLPDKEILWSETYLDPKQLKWIKDTIEGSQKPVLVFCHELFMLREYENLNDHVILNRDDAVKIFEESDKVKAVFCGHYHFGDYVLKNGIHYVTFGSLCLHEDLTCAVVTIDKNELKIEGFGRQESMQLKLR